MPPGLGCSRALSIRSDLDLHHPWLQRWPGSSLRARRGVDPSLLPRVEPTAWCGRCSVENTMKQESDDAKAV